MSEHDQMLTAIDGVKDSAFFRALADLQRRDASDVTLSERLRLFLSVFADVERRTETCPCGVSPLSVCPWCDTADADMQKVRDAVPTASLQELFNLFDRARWACADELFYRGVEPAAEPGALAL